MGWDHPFMSGNPYMMALSFQMAAFTLLMNPANYKHHQERSK